MSFLIAVDDDRAYIYDYTPERYDELHENEVWEGNIFVCTLDEALQIGLVPSTPDGRRRDWADLTMGIYTERECCGSAAQRY
jgi:hypothetical protein